MRNGLLVAAIVFLSACDSSDTHVLTVDLTGDGAGAINAPGLSCSKTICTGSYEDGKSLSLAAVPDASSLFGGWDGACKGTGGCTVTLDRNRSVSASFLAAQRQVTVAIRVDGGGIAAVGSDTPGLHCTATACTGTFATGATVKLTAFPLQTRFVRWTGKCQTVAPECTFAPGPGDNSITAVFLTANYVFATSTTLPALQLSPAKADAECNVRAAAAQLPGNYVAWLSTSSLPAAPRLRSARGWVRLDGLPFADSVDSMTAGAILYPVQFDETGAVSSFGVLTGTNAAGTVGENCNDFTDPAAPMSLGRPTGGTGAWTSWAVSAACKDVSLGVYCFGTDTVRSVAPVRPPPPVRNAFVSTGTLRGDSGIPAFDGLCSSEAAAAGLSGTYRALVATTASAASRFDLTGAPWARVDGVAVTAKGADLATPSLLAPIDVTADGAYSTARLAWTGATTPGEAGTSERTCDRWTGTAAIPMGAVGLPTLTQTPGQPLDASFFNFGVFACSTTAAVYCLQQ